MATLREIKRRISSIKSTEQITKAMKMVAAAKMRKAQENILAARPYAGNIDRLIKNILKTLENPTDPLLTPQEIGRVLMVVVTADRGLCGSFNTNLIKRAVMEIHENLDKEVDIITVGRKGTEFFKKRDYNVIGSYINVFNQLDYNLAPAIVEKLVSHYRSGKVGRVKVVYNQFKSAIQQDVVVEQMLPVVPDSSESQEVAGYDYIYEPNKDQLLTQLLPKQLNVQMWKILLESFAAEQGARMTAMENATENAQEMISTLTLQFNRARQASITTELSEIVGGAEALKG